MPVPHMLGIRYMYPLMLRMAEILQVWWKLCRAHAHPWLNAWDMHLLIYLLLHALTCMVNISSHLMKPSNGLVFWSLSGVCLHPWSAMKSLLVGCWVLKLLNLDLSRVSSLLIVLGAAWSFPPWFLHPSWPISSCQCRGSMSLLLVP